MKFVHIAGTNGKGSVAEYISSIITAADKRCGCFTSPHLVSHTERLRIDGKCISDDELARLMNEVKACGLAVNDTLFAAYTAAALLWFARSDALWAVMETGLGGRLDPTNAILPDVTVLTMIDYDHADVLGNRLEQIAEEKCGIIKPGVSVVSAAQHPAVRDIIAAHCEDVGSPLRFVGDVAILSRTLEGQTFVFEGGKYGISEIGQAQPQNAALAVLACKALGFGEATILAGLKAATIIARTQYIKGDPDIVLDGAHNASAAVMLTKTLDQYFLDKDKVLLFACMQNKDHESIIDAMKGQFYHVVTTRIDSTRGAEAKALCENFSKHTKCETELDPHLAFDKAQTIAKKDNALLVVSGSLYLAGAVWHRIQNV